jgi:hypothetical protein
MVIRMYFLVVNSAPAPAHRRVVVQCVSTPPPKQVTEWKTREIPAQPTIGGKFLSCLLIGSKQFCRAPQQQYAAG